MRRSTEKKKIYYFVNINYPIKAESMDVDMLKEATKDFGDIIDDGEFTLVGHGSTHSYLMYKFKTSKAASEAKHDNFAVTKTDVSTNSILCDTRPIVTIDLVLTTETFAKEAAERVAKGVISKVVQMVKARPSYAELLESLQSITTATIGVEFAIPQLPIPVPESMLNELIRCQVEPIAKDMGFSVTFNSGRLDDQAATQYSRYFNSRPDLTIYHPKKSVAYMVQHTQPVEEMEEEVDKEQVTLRGGMAENNSNVKSDDIGQLLAGMDKVAGHLAHKHLQRDLPDNEKSFEIIEIYGLLCDFGTKKCQVYKLVMYFEDRMSKLYCGDQEVDLSTGISGLIATLKSAE